MNMTLKMLYRQHHCENYEHLAVETQPRRLRRVLRGTDCNVRKLRESWFMFSVQ
jgi:hypothetical protein